ncbi:hypothetical protein ABG067_005555 [Albugo candida]
MKALSMKTFSLFVLQAFQERQPFVGGAYVDLVPVSSTTSERKLESGLGVEIHPPLVFTHDGALVEAEESTLYDVKLIIHAEKMNSMEVEYKGRVPGIKKIYYTTFVYANGYVTGWIMAEETLKQWIHSGTLVRSDNLMLLDPLMYIRNFPGIYTFAMTSDTRLPYLYFGDRFSISGYRKSRRDDLKHEREEVMKNAKERRNEEQKEIEERHKVFDKKKYEENMVTEGSQEIKLFGSTYQCMLKFDPGMGATRIPDKAYQKLGRELGKKVVEKDGRYQGKCEDIKKSLKVTKLEPLRDRFSISFWTRHHVEFNYLRVLLEENGHCILDLVNGHDSCVLGTSFLGVLAYNVEPSYDPIAKPYEIHLAAAVGTLSDLVTASDTNPDECMEHSVGCNGVLQFFSRYILPESD